MARVLRWLRRVILAGLALWVLTILALVGFAALAPPMIAAAPLPADRIVVLGGGPLADGPRMARGAALYAAEQAPALHITSSPRSAARMARAAAAQAIPGAALTVEAASYSTLQNALFSQPALDGTDHLILVTEAWHLPRAWASFVWAGDQRLSLAWSARYGPPAQALRMIPREAAAIWFNAGRAALWQVAGWLSVPRARRDGWLQ
jgi:uncharacterized SAM-binding protein YcdF (DUF218 family)